MVQVRILAAERCAGGVSGRGSRDGAPWSVSAPVSGRDGPNRGGGAPFRIGSVPVAPASPRPRAPRRRQCSRSRPARTPADDPFAGGIRRAPRTVRAVRRGCLRRHRAGRGSGQAHALTASEGAARAGRSPPGLARADRSGRPCPRPAGRRPGSRPRAGDGVPGIGGRPAARRRGDPGPAARHGPRLRLRAGGDRAGRRHSAGDLRRRPPAAHRDPRRPRRDARGHRQRRHRADRRGRRSDGLRPDHPRRCRRARRHRRAEGRHRRAAAGPRGQLGGLRVRRVGAVRRSRPVVHRERLRGALSHGRGGHRAGGRAARGHGDGRRPGRDRGGQRPGAARGSGARAQRPADPARAAGGGHGARSRDDLAARRRRRRPGHGAAARHLAAGRDRGRQRLLDRAGHHPDRVHGGRRRVGGPLARARRGDRRPGPGGPLQLPPAGRRPRPGQQGRRVRGDQELPHRRRVQGAAPVVRRGRHHRDRLQHRRRHDRRQLRRRAQTRDGRRRPQLRRQQQHPGRARRRARRGVRRGRLDDHRRRGCRRPRGRPRPAAHQPRLGRSAPARFRGGGGRPHGPHRDRPPGAPRPD